MQERGIAAAVILLVPIQARLVVLAEVGMEVLPWGISIDPTSSRGGTININGAHPAAQPLRFMAMDRIGVQGQRVLWTDSGVQRLPIDKPVRWRPA